MSERQREAARKIGTENRKLERGIFDPSFDRSYRCRAGIDTQKRLHLGIFGPKSQYYRQLGAHVAWHVKRGVSYPSTCRFCADEFPANAESDR